MNIRMKQATTITIEPDGTYGAKTSLRDRGILTSPLKLSGECEAPDEIAEYLISKGHAEKLELEEAPVEDDALAGTDIGELSYRDLQALAKERDLNATGSAEEIRARIEEHLEG